MLGCRAVHSGLGASPLSIRAAAGAVLWLLMTAQASAAVPCADIRSRVQAAAREYRLPIDTLDQGSEAFRTVDFIFYQATGQMICRDGALSREPSELVILRSPRVDTERDGMVATGHEIYILAAVIASAVSKELQPLSIRSDLARACHQAASEKSITTFTFPEGLELSCSFQQDRTLVFLAFK